MCCNYIAKYLLQLPYQTFTHSHIVNQIKRCVKQYHISRTALEKITKAKTEKANTKTSIVKKEKIESNKI